MAAILPNTAALVASATGHLGAYQLSARVWGESPARALRLLQHWSCRACAWLRLDVQVHGQPSATPCLYVANHRSYLDIPLLASVLGATFMSRADIANWPVVGTAARAVGTVFVERDDFHGRVRAARALWRRVQTTSVVVFPEGTTHGDRLPAAFHPGLFRLLHRRHVRIVPVTIRYNDPRAYWVDDVTMGAHLRSHVLRGPRIVGAVHIGNALTSDAHRDPNELARAVHAAVCRPIEELGEVV
jgi:1-acyl-sn-glycerol-3-phosphate acyltransferase